RRGAGAGQVIPALGFPAGFQAPAPILFLGLVTGATYGLLAVGLVLVFRANRIINFAHGETGAFAAAVLGVLVVNYHLPYWGALLGPERTPTARVSPPCPWRECRL